jgi:hypothetical protein
MRASGSVSLSEAGRSCWWSFEKRPKLTLPSAEERNEPSLEGIAMKLNELSELLGRKNTYTGIERGPLIVVQPRDRGR